MSQFNKTDRRDFLKTSVKGTLAASIGTGALGSLLESCSSSKAVTVSSFRTGFDQKPLPYKYDALENVIDATTMEIHYTKHAAAYSKNLKDAIQAEGLNAGQSLEEILANVSKYSTKIRNNGGGHYNHEMFWQCMRPKQNNNLPSGKLLSAIEGAFTSFADFKTQFSDAGKNRFGSGWAWLYADNNKALKIGSTPNQDNPIMNVSDIKGFPLLGLDVWEHAYYLKYQNKRADYIDNWWNLVNWDYVAQRYAAFFKVSV
ncbi:MAG TPA: superoxide dismutase [Chitinophagaceae bacterium]|nr:superoxide dismutase [Chitinophagaceae bacterium]